ncbi:hypothetical protein CUMW_198170, partial [Citrus unshiu]
LAAIDIHRIWWLKHLSSTEPSSSYTFLFGWFVSCTPASLDIVVALARDDSSLSGCQSSLKMVYDLYKIRGRNIHCIPKSHHIHWNGRSVLHCDVHFWITIVDMHYIKSLFDTAWINIQICCGQILFWPILLQVNDLSRVEYAEKAALHKHSMWSSLAVDVLLNQTAYGFWNFANDATKELLCIGVHAGFKLNTELAGVLGMISLHAIQIWSALWFFMDALLLYLVKGLAMLGILFGMTVPAAFIRDMIVLVTLHVSTLHWVMSLLYSQQITSISSFMALVQLLNHFGRGRKWNLLRQRLDSYEYTLKQHIVGSLIFTPLLLLLPTSVFYIFFTMMNSSISLVCMLIEVVISIMHATPYINIELWLVRRRRFPPGIWFEIVSCHGSSDNPPEIVSLDTISSPSKNSLHLENISGRSHVLVAILHSNFLTVVCASVDLSKLGYSIESLSCVSLSSIPISEFHLLLGPSFLRECLGCSSHSKSIGVFFVIQPASQNVTVIYFNDIIH